MDEPREYSANLQASVASSLAALDLDAKADGMARLAMLYAEAIDEWHGVAYEDEDPTSGLNVLQWFGPKLAGVLQALGATKPLEVAKAKGPGPLTSFRAGA